MPLTVGDVWEELAAGRGFYGVLPAHFFALVFIYYF